MELTPRMKNWIEAFGVHAAVATSSGFPTVVVTDQCSVDFDTIKLPLSDKQKSQIAGALSENDYVAVAPGKLGAVRAPYQFKGRGKIEGDALVVGVTQIYCTKPGAEAGIRLDVMGFEEMKSYDESRWKDIKPPSK